MDERDIMVTWLEQGDNFSHATHIPSNNDTAQVKQAKKRVWIELEMAVNTAIPNAGWTPQIAFQSVGECIMEYLKAANEAKIPDFKVNALDKQRGINSIQEKLEDKCRHYARLAKLHAPKNVGNIFQKVYKSKQITSERNQHNTRVKAKEKEQEQQQPPGTKKSEKGLLGLPKADSIVLDSDESKESESMEMKFTRQEEKKRMKSAGKLELVESDDEVEDEAFPVRPAVKRPIRLTKKSPRCDEDDGAPWLRRKLRRVSRHAESAEIGTEVQLQLQVSGPAHTTRSVTSDTPRRRGQSDSTSSLKRIEKSFDIDEPLARTRSRASTCKTHSQHETQRVSASRRVTRSSDREEKSNQAGVSDAKPTGATRSTISAESRRRVGTYQQDAYQRVERSVKDDRQSSRAKMPVTKTTPTTADGANAPRREDQSSDNTGNPHQTGVPAVQSTRVVNGASNGDRQRHATTVGTDVQNGKLRRAEIPVLLPTQTTASITASDESQQNMTGKKDALRCVAEGRHPKNGEPPVQATQAEHDRTRNARSDEQQGHKAPQVSDVLRSAIAQVVSQRQQLLNSRTSAASNARILPSGLASENEVSEGESLAEGLISAEHDADKERSSWDHSLVRGFRPPLFNVHSPVDGKKNLERKRAYLHAKQLAFEQVKWHSENKLQTREVSLLRREMEAREMLAHKELKLKQLRIRAEVMQPMILAGASVADIAEQLKLL